MKKRSKKLLLIASGIPPDPEARMLAETSKVFGAFFVTAQVARKTRQDSSFLKKRSKKLLQIASSIWRNRGGTEVGRNRQKFFGSFFQKRTSFLIFLVEIFP